MRAGLLVVGRALRRSQTPSLSRGTLAPRNVCIRGFSEKSDNPLTPEFQEFLKRTLAGDSAKPSAQEERKLPGSLQNLVESLGVESTNMLSDDRGRRNVDGSKESVLNSLAQVSNGEYFGVDSTLDEEINEMNQYSGTISPKLRNQVVRAALSKAIADFRVLRSPLSIDEYNGLLRVARSCFSSQLADVIVEMMSLRGVDPDVETISILVNIFSEGGRPAKALELFDQLAQRGVTPSYNAYLAAMRACRELPNAPRALALLEEINGSADAAAAGGNSSFADASMLRTVMSACAAAGLWEEALQLLSQRESAAPAVAPAQPTFTPPAAGAAAAEGEEASPPNPMVGGRHLGGAPADAHLTALDYTIAASACGVAGRAAEAVALLARAENKGVALDSALYEAVICALGLQGRWQDAEALLERMLDSHVMPSRVLYRAVMDARFPAGFRDPAEAPAPATPPAAAAQEAADAAATSAEALLFGSTSPFAGDNSDSDGEAGESSDSDSSSSSAPAGPQ